MPTSGPEEKAEVDSVVADARYRYESGLCVNIGESGILKPTHIDQQLQRMKKYFRVAE
jgi:hypothetical protein